MESFLDMLNSAVNNETAVPSLVGLVHDFVEENYGEFSGSPVPKKTFRIYFLVIVTLIGCVAIFGVVSNVINIVVFYRQGPMSHSSTVVMTGLSISDLLVCILATIYAIFSIADKFIDVETWSLDIQEFVQIVVVRPLNYASQVTCWMTTYMTIERAISVTFPFKVKVIFTPKRALAVVLLIFILTFCLYCPSLFEKKMGWTIRYDLVTYAAFHPSGLVPEILLTIYFYTNPVFLRFTSVFVVVMCNVIIFWKVYLSQKFRKSKANSRPSAALAKAKGVSNESTENTLSNTNTQSVSNESTSKALSPSSTNTQGVLKKSSSQTNTQGVSKESKSQGTTHHNTNKEMKLLRMIVVVSVVFSVCYSLSIIQVTVFFLVYTLHEDYHWAVEDMTYVSALLLLILNSSVNIVIYYNMSSRFKEELQLCCKRVEKNYS